jgi:O-antigen/teichoic acid export membrane protein
MDQGLYSASNVVLTIVVARTVDAEAFGAFSLCYVLYLLLLGLARSTGSKPFTIERSLESDEVFRAQTRRLMGYGLGLGGLSAALSLLVGRLVSGPLSDGLTVLAVLLPGLLLQDAVRGVYFARQQPRAAFLNDALWIVLQVAAIATALVTLDPPAMTLLMAGWGVPAAVAACVGILHLRALPGRPVLLGWLRPHAALASPLALNLVLTAAPSYVAYLAMPAVSTLDQLAVVRGAYVFFGPLNVVYTGLALVALPAFVRAAGAVSRRRMSTRVSAGLVAAAVAWGAVVVLLPDSVGRLVLGSLWDDTQATRVLLALSLVAEALLVGPEIALSSLRLPRRMTGVRLVGALVTLTSSIGLAAVYGATGLAAGFVLGYWTAALLAQAEVRRITEAGGGERAVSPAEVAED